MTEEPATYGQDGPQNVLRGAANSVKRGLAVDKKQTPVSEQFDSQSYWLDELDAAVARLESNIQTVLKSAEPQPETDSKVPSAGESGVYFALQSNNRRLANMVGALQNINSRVEL